MVWLEERVERVRFEGKRKLPLEVENDRAVQIIVWLQALCFALLLVILWVVLQKI